jgi:flagellar P-ring protein FlgI
MAAKSLRPYKTILNQFLNTMNHLRKIILLFLAFSISIPLSAARIKDITTIQGIRDNQLSGVGLVSGLSRDGDKNLTLTNQALSNLIREYGLNVSVADIKTKNMAIVTVTADIGGFAKEGDRIDVTVASVGDAKSLNGGVLLQTPLKAANGQVYAVAQGAIAVGGFIGGDEGGATIQKNHPTVGIISDGAIVEQPINTNIVNQGAIDLKLRNPDFTTAVRIADRINMIYPASSQAFDPSNVNVIVPEAFHGQTPNFIAAVSDIEVEPDVPARVVINERTGTIVATADVRISEVAISYGALVIQVQNQNDVSQPGGAFNQGTTQQVTNQNTKASEQERSGGFKPLPDYGKDSAGNPIKNPSVQQLADALNKMGVTTRDMIAILQTLKKSGALQAELIIN